MCVRKKKHKSLPTTMITCVSAQKSFTLNCCTGIFPVFSIPRPSKRC